MTWDHKDEWRKRGKDFLVMVSRHEAMGEDREPRLWCDSEGPHRWAVYAYIYPQHQHFLKFNGDTMWQDATSVLPLHCGCTFLRYHYNVDGEITCVQVGADYHHIDDDHYTHAATADEAHQVFEDAKELFEWLDSFGKETND